MRYSCLVAMVVGLRLISSTATVEAMPDDPGGFTENDVRVFRTTACTKDQVPVEALYFIAASRSDLASGRPSPTFQLMKEEVDQSWLHIASRLTSDEVTEERFADSYHALLSERIPLLQQAVKEKSGVSVYVSEVNSRVMDAAQDPDTPACRRGAGEPT